MFIQILPTCINILLCFMKQNIFVFPHRIFINKSSMLKYKHKMYVSI